jgi:hypothetical protein
VNLFRWKKDNSNYLLQKRKVERLSFFVCFVISVKAFYG